ncbi:hypothetical protein PBI_SCTP2_45 [Salicola phage SCTP-2]|nr:hypothetical protein PBI_SCTP2_45 [Salicola phage SCTP-2]
MKIKHITQYLFESYKDAQSKFAQEASEEEVKQYLDTFKQLAKKGTVSGQEKDIGYWIKQGWNSFKEFVDSKSQEKSKSEVKKSKKKDSIIAHEDNEKMVVIPLTKDASCYYGKNTKWCTSGNENNKFNEYFYLKNIVLFYVYMKTNNEKFAAVYSKMLNKFEYFNNMDEGIDESQFKKQTDITTDELYIWYNENEEKIESMRDINNASEEDQLNIIQLNINKFPSIKNPSEKLQLEAVKEDGLIIKQIKNPSDDVKLEAIKNKPSSIDFIDNPTEEMKMKAVTQSGPSIRFIDNPTEEMKMKAVKYNGENIQFIDNPSEEVQLEAVKRDSSNIRFIDNPSEKIQLEAVKRDSSNIRFINNPTERIQLEAVKQNPWSINYIDNPSEKIQLEAVKEYPKIIANIENPSDKVIKQYEKLTQKSYTNPDDVQKDEMNDLDDFVQSLKK